MHRNQSRNCVFQRKLMILPITLLALSLALACILSPFAGPSDSNMTAVFRENKTELKRFVNDPGIHERLKTSAFPQSILSDKLRESGFRWTHTYNVDGIHFVLWELRTPIFSKEKGIAYYPKELPSDFRLTNLTNLAPSSSDEIVFAKELEPNWYCYSKEFTSNN